MNDEPTITLPAHLFRALLEAAVAVSLDGDPSYWETSGDEVIAANLMTDLRAALEPLKDWRDAA